MTVKKKKVRKVLFPKVATARGKGRVSMAAAKKTVKKVLAARAAARSKSSRG